MADVNNFELWGAMANAYHAILRSRFVETGKIGLTPPKAQILHIIQSNGGSVLQNKISAITMRRQHSVSDLVNRMVREGLINKKRLPNDRRYLLTIAEKGKQKHNRLTQQSIEMIFSALTPEDSKSLCTGLGTLLARTSPLDGANDTSANMDDHETSNFELWGMLAHANFAISRPRFMEIADGGLTPEKAKILRIIQNNGGSIAQNKISDITMRRQHSVSDLVNRMVREGLITKTKSPVDRVFIIKMSRKGETRYNNLKRHTLDTIFDALTLEERLGLYQALTRLLVKSRSLLGLDYTTPF